nr:hypothetical protein [Tanacetum cinerariifolium]
MSHSSSLHTTLTASGTGHTTSLFRQPTCSSEEDLTEHLESEHEISNGRTASVPYPTPTTVLPQPPYP